MMTSLGILPNRVLNQDELLDLAKNLVAVNRKSKYIFFSSLSQNTVESAYFNRPRQGNNAAFLQALSLSDIKRYWKNEVLPFTKFGFNKEAIEGEVQYIYKGEGDLYLELKDIDTENERFYDNRAYHKASIHDFFAGLLANLLKTEECTPCFYCIDKFFYQNYNRNDMQHPDGRTFLGIIDQALKKVEFENPERKIRMYIISAGTDTFQSRNPLKNLEMVCKNIEAYALLVPGSDFRKYGLHDRHLGNRYFGFDFSAGLTVFRESKKKTNEYNCINKFKVSITPSESWKTIMECVKRYIPE